MRFDISEALIFWLSKKNVLIDKKSLANLMIDHNIGVSDFASYEVKRIDQDYFIED
jgi:restriction system protein